MGSMNPMEKIRAAIQQIREQRSVSQEELAALLNVSQASISKLESRSDMRLSTLRRVIAALGGKLEVRARFPEGIVEIRQADDELERESRSAGRASIARDAPPRTPRKKNTPRRAPARSGRPTRKRAR